MRLMMYGRSRLGWSLFPLSPVPARLPSCPHEPITGLTGAWQQASTLHSAQVHRAPQGRLPETGGRPALAHTRREESPPLSPLICSSSWSPSATLTLPTASFPFSWSSSSSHFHSFHPASSSFSPHPTSQSHTSSLQPVPSSSLRFPPWRSRLSSQNAPLSGCDGGATQITNPLVAEAVAIEESSVAAAAAAANTSACFLVYHWVYSRTRSRNSFSGRSSNSSSHLSSGMHVGSSSNSGNSSIRGFSNSSGSDNSSSSGSGSGNSWVEGLLSPALEARLRQLHNRCGQLEAMLAGSAGDGGADGGGGSVGARRDIGREYSKLKPLAVAYERLLRVRQELEDLGVLLKDPDPRIRAMAEEEGREVQQQAAGLTRLLLLALVPRDPRDGRAALLEVRAGAGGQEAALFCGELLEMYRKFAMSRGWSWQVVELTASEVPGGMKHVVAAVADGRGAAGDGSGGYDGDDGDGDENGDASGVYGTLLPESGVHRVQRVPVTEAQGRVHTSTAAVVVLPQADEVDVKLRDEDLRVETMRASGAGGQHVNVTDSAVRITHVPTGLVVSCQNERSQHLNRASALKILRARLYDLEMQKRAKEMDEQRSALVASADRSERIRTYNFPQGRVTDHRIHLTLHDLDSVLEGGEGLQVLMGALRAAREEESLRRLGEQEEAAGIAVEEARKRR